MEYRPPGPLILTIVVMVGATLLGIVYLPLAELQVFLWSAAFITFLIGDTITTGLLGDYGLEEQQVGYTRWLCGSEPTMRCALFTRLLVLVIALIGQITVLWTGFGIDYGGMAAVVLVLPLLLASGGVTATVINAHAIFNSERVGRD